ncbi:MAG: RHS repeat-associated core domain-containing protein, partial [Armatimonadetes bacterium]|nr:RHS repeat-associated core domain-containing protein [Armatimonadota bacterium]
TNSAQAVVGQRLTDAFGNQISSSGVWKGRFAYGGPYGYQEDPDTGLHLLGHRYYDSSTGRFLTRDPIKDGRNWYVYCESNPVSAIDPTGLVKIIAYYYSVGLWGIEPGYHWFLIIIDNRVGSPTYGKVWYVSGYPRDDWTTGPLVAEVESNRDKAYDGRQREMAGNTLDTNGIILVNDQSEVGPWVEKAKDRAAWLNWLDISYDVKSNNSNTVFYEMLSALGLLGAFNKALGKRKKAGHWSPWSPGIGHVNWGGGAAVPMDPSKYRGDK